MQLVGMLSMNFLIQDFFISVNYCSEWRCHFVFLIISIHKVTIMCIVNSSYLFGLFSHFVLYIISPQNANAHAVLLLL